MPRGSLRTAGRPGRPPPTSSTSTSDMAVRSFTMACQRSFAELSGDRNPVHVDPLTAPRSLLGGVAVHGIHRLLWARDELAAGRDLRGFARLRMQFERGVVVGDPV